MFLISEPVNLTAPTSFPIIDILLHIKTDLNNPEQAPCAGPVLRVRVRVRVKGYSRITTNPKAILKLCY
jgi:hypothetical protein